MFYICTTRTNQHNTMENQKTYTLVKAIADDTRQIEELPNGDLATLQNAVGGYIEPVYLNEMVMWVNEEGLLRGLPINLAATLMAGKQIVGDVVLEQEVE